MKSDKKVALITGSSTGVGAATGLNLASEGWNVVINYSKSKKEAEQAAAKMAMENFLETSKS